MEFSLALLCIISLDSPQDYLNAHNAAGAQVGVGPMTWDNNVAAYAHSYAISRMGDCNLIHSGGPYGENLAEGSAMARKSKGRQKIEITRMSKESNRLVTFSKRRSGLFKKASELCTLCGAELAIIVFSPAKKAFSFGHPCVDTIVDRFLSRNTQPNSGSLQLVEAHRNANVRELNLHLTEALDTLEAEKKKGEELNKMRKDSRDKCWWEAPVSELGLQQLEQLKVAMEDLKKNVVKQGEKIQMEESNPSRFFAAGSSSMGGHVGGGPHDVKVSGLGLSMTPHGYTLGYGHGFF
ncbi:hypothetical protein TEA_025184 [Camellia sinensis var. sinensis]|uniref:MADS-box domain-containing protein n=1 Tax=Camellia sinensis var. sinensis TaxID=542762 RepID=A0A4S4E3G1_CAMSN|nr:hypothetical protein TEA_025184 [Camellia sinensis var. sinensis]